MKAAKPPLIVLTGGGTAGHIMPHLALLPYFAAEGWQVYYIGSHGMEKDIVAAAQVDFYAIASGKLRRYLTWENFVDFFKVGLGFLQAIGILLRRRPQLVFSKGGFVSVPVALAAWLLRIPVITHESDLTPGLATKIISKVAVRVLHAFAETRAFLPASKAVETGIPIRRGLSEGSAKRALEICGFSADLGTPVIVVMGGSSGAQRLNDALLAALPRLLQRYRIVHITGKGKGSLTKAVGYKTFEFVGDELGDLLAVASLVVCRAGATSLFELLALRKPMLLIPLELGSRGDQVHNAHCFVKKGWARELREKDLTAVHFERCIDESMAAAGAMVAAQVAGQGLQASEAVIGVLRTFMTTPLPASVDPARDSSLS